MASKAKGIRAARAFVELFADDTKLVRGLKRAQRKMRAWSSGLRSIGTKLTAVGAAIVTPMLAAVKSFATAGDALDKMSGRVGVSVEFLSKLSFAARIGGTSIDAMEVGIRRMQRTALDAQRGLSTATDAFNALGVSVTNSSGNLKSTEQLFAESTASLSKVQNNTKKAALATMLFGRAGTSLLPMLKDGAGGMAAMMREAEQLGLVMSADDASAAAALTDAWTRLSTSLKMVVVQLGSALAPLLLKTAKYLLKLLRPLIDWVKNNKTLVVSLFKIGTAIVAAGVALLGLSLAIGAMAPLISVVIGAITGIGTVLGALLSPIGLVLAGLAGLATWFLTSTEAGGQALSWLGDQFAELKTIALGAFDGIKDALGAGDFALAAKILWLSLKAAWVQGTQGLRQLWITVKEEFVSVWTEAVFNVAKISVNAWAELETSWQHTVGFLQDAWTIMSNGIANTWHKTIGFIKKAWVHLKGLFDSDINVDAEVKRINTEVSAKTNANQDAQNKAIFEREQPRKKALAAIEVQRSGTLETLQQQRDAARAKNEQKFAAQREASDKALAAARQQQQTAIETAKDKKEKHDKQKNKDGKQQPSILDLIKRIPEARQSTTAAAKITTAGTFNAMATRGFSASRPVDRIANATEQTAKHTKKFLDHARLYKFW